jgi:hypothetical protein
MTRPLVITDCDEVLLHMVSHFRDYVDEEHSVDFRLDSPSFTSAMRWRDTGAVLPEAEMWRLLNLFFDTEMHRQTAIPGAVDAINTLSLQADVVVLTNLNDHRQALRTAQLADIGIHVRVFTNQGPKGPAIRAIIEEYAPTRAVFIDDIAQHHASAMADVPHVTRLHFVGEPAIAPHVPCAHGAGHAHARIDSWGEALPWLMAQLEQENS